MLIETLSGPYRLARSVFYTNNGYQTIIPRTTEPIGDALTATGLSVIDLGGAAGGVTQNKMRVVPCAVASDTNTFSIRVHLWNRAPGVVGSSLDLWVPTPIIEVACTATSGMPGVAGAILDNTVLFADTLSVTKGSTLSGELPNEMLYSPANDTIGWFEVFLHGAQKVSLDFTTGGSATSCNALLLFL